MYASDGHFAFVSNSTKPFRLSSTHCCAPTHTHTHMVASLWLDTVASTDCRVEAVRTALAAAVKVV